MNENIKKFMEALQADKELESALKQAMEGIKPEEQEAALVKFAQEKGFDISEADLNPDGQEVSPDELDNVAGGVCACPVLGGGNGIDVKTGTSYTCACIIAGDGDNGKLDQNCLCVVCGGGEDDSKLS